MGSKQEVIVALYLIQFADINMQQLNDAIALFHFFSTSTHCHWSFIPKKWCSLVRQPKFFVTFQ